MAARVKIATTVGAPITDDPNTITAGAHAPVLMQAHQLVEKLVHRNRKHIAERTVHARGRRPYGEPIIAAAWPSTLRPTRCRRAPRLR